MCYSCWEQMGSPKIDNPAVRRAVALAARVYEDSSMGGALHAQLDDWNLDDEHFAPPYFAKLATDAEQACFTHWQSMSIAERASALALFEGIWSATPPGTTPSGHLFIQPEAVTPTVRFSCPHCHQTTELTTPQLVACLELMPKWMMRAMRRGRIAMFTACLACDHCSQVAKTIQCNLRDIPGLVTK